MARTAPKTFDEAVVLDGCGTILYLVHFIFPMSKPVYTSAARFFNAIFIKDVTLVTENYPLKYYYDLHTYTQ